MLRWIFGQKRFTLFIVMVRRDLPYLLSGSEEIYPIYCQGQKRKMMHVINSSPELHTWHTEKTFQLRIFYLCTLFYHFKRIALNILCKSNFKKKLKDKCCNTSVLDFSPNCSKSWWMFFNAKLAIFQLYDGENKIYSMKMIMMSALY
jgi:hypothetical protein